MRIFILLNCVFMLLNCSNQNNVNFKTSENEKFEAYVNLDLDSFLLFNSKNKLIFKKCDYKVVLNNKIITNRVLNYYTINYSNGRRLVFDHANTKNKRIIIYNDEQLKVKSIFLDSNLKIDNELVIDYTETEFYKINGHPSLLILISYPMNFVGKMSSNSFYQLIDLKKMIVYEFFNFSNNPNVLRDINNDFISVFNISLNYHSDDSILTYINPFNISR